MSLNGNIDKEVMSLRSIFQLERETLCGSVPSVKSS